jgi:hypothetical protein
MSKYNCVFCEEPMHVDDWVQIASMENNPLVKYAAIFLLIHRLPSVVEYAMYEVLPETAPDKMKLFCTYQGKRYRVTGASRMGDVWLQTNFDKDHGYLLRVTPTHCSEWNKEP